MHCTCTWQSICSEMFHIQKIPEERSGQHCHIIVLRMMCTRGEKEVSFWKYKQLLWCFLQQVIQVWVFESYEKITLHKHWYIEIVEKQWLQTKTKKKEAKTKPTWSSRISYCILLILFSFIVVPNVSPSYWDGCYLCTLQKEMIKEDFFPVWETNFFFLCVLPYSVEGETDSKTNVSYI